MIFLRIIIVIGLVILFYALIKQLFLKKTTHNAQEIYLEPQKNNSVFLEVVCTIIGIGIGLLVAVLLNQKINSDYREMFNLGIVLIFGGLGVLMGYAIKKKI